MRQLGFDRYEAEFLAETDRLGVMVSGVDPDLALPTCPEWTVRELVTHVGTGHRWAADIVAGRLTAPPPYALVPGPAESAQWATWLRAGASRLVHAVRDGGPDQTVWTWRDDATAGFWVRKMLHDEIVHRFDVELATAGPGAIAPDLAADGVSDLFDTVATLSRSGLRHPVFGGLAGTGETLHLHATDPVLAGAGEWFAQRTPAGVTWRHGHARADVAVRAPVRELLLVLNRRLPPDAAEIIGDDAQLTHWLNHTQF